MKQIYMDHHATTPVDPVVLNAMMPFFTDDFGNPSSNTHEYGHRARDAVEKARKRLADLIGAASPDEIVFTSGATEANNLALKGRVAAFQHQARRNIITDPIEHKSVLDPLLQLEKQGVELRYCRLNRYGDIDLDHLQSLIDDHTVLISIQAANSEVGTLQPLSEIGTLARGRGVLFHSDAVQALGRIVLNVVRQHIDLLSISAHKMYGPKGVGALYVRKGVKLVSLLDGGGHERGMRSGSYNVPGIVGMGMASELAGRDLEAHAQSMRTLQQRLLNGLKNRIEKIYLNGPAENRLPNNLNISFQGAEGESLLLSCPGVALSTGSACNSESSDSSYVLRALQVPSALARCSVRFGLGKINTESQVDEVADMLAKAVERLRKLSPQFNQEL